jgi:multiphosphoryl transfer protein
LAGLVAVIDLLSPLAGWALPLHMVADPVFSAGLAGDGVAIDPTGETVHAPCDGVVMLPTSGRHAITLRTALGDVLIHVGIDTIRLAREIFRVLVRDGEAVCVGQPLIEFDLDMIARHATSAVTPFLLTGAAAPRIVRRQLHTRIGVGDPLLSLDAADDGHQAIVAVAGEVHIGRFRVPFEHGFHARPAARIAAALTGLSAEVTFRANGRSGNARSPVSLMTLGVQRGDSVEAAAIGVDGREALGALGSILEPIPEMTSSPARGRDSATESASVRVILRGRLPAVVAVPGLALGVAVPVLMERPRVPDATANSEVERSRLRNALESVVAQLEQLAVGDDLNRRAVLDAHLALARDPELLRGAELRVAAGSSAGEAWRTVIREATDSLARLDDARMAERRADLVDLENQVLRVLGGGSLEHSVVLPDRAILIADELLPSQLLRLDTTRLAGICMAAGGATSHVAILASSFGIPTLVAAGEAVLTIIPGTRLIVDAEAGFLHVDPPAQELKQHETAIAAQIARQAAEAATAVFPAALANGTSICVSCNLDSVADAGVAVRAGAEGCGLLRTEFLFLDRSKAPDAGEQLAAYQKIATTLEGRPLTIRTLDIGGDKPIPFLPAARESNPALGLRGLRTSLHLPELLEVQFRAIVCVEPPGQCRVLLPMVTDVADIRMAREYLLRAARDAGRPVPALGAMIETPSAALLIDQIAAEVDFVAIGTNDLSQYTLAIDRLHPILARRLDAIHPAVLRLIAATARVASESGRGVCVCGDLAADPDAVPLLIGLGVRDLSLTPRRIPQIKSLVRTLSLAHCEALAGEALMQVCAQSVRRLVRARMSNQAADPRRRDV